MALMFPSGKRKDQVITDQSLIHMLIDTAIEGAPKIKCQTKNNKMAKEKIHLAVKKTISKAPINEILRYHNSAIAHVPTGSTDLLAKAYANRSATLTSHQMYSDSLKDIERALETVGCPEDLKAKLFARKAKNLLGLNSQMRHEVHEAMNQAILWMEKIDENERKGIQSILDKLEKPKCLKDPSKKWDSDIFMPKIINDNAKILHASSAIDISQSDKYGRQVVATEDISAGQAVAVYRSYASIVMPDSMHEFCWNCSKYTWSCVPCNTCTAVVYCDEKCRDDAWREHHDMECRVIDVIVATEDTKDHLRSYEIMALRMLTKGLKEFGSLQALQEKTQALDAIEDPILRALTDNVYDDTKYASVYSLFCKDVKDRVLGFGVIAYRLLYIIASQTTQIFGKKIHDGNELKSNQLAPFLGRLLQHHLHIIETNAIGLHMIPSYDRDATVNYVIALSSLMSIFNHSCDFNAYLFISGDRHAVIPIQKIKKGEQVFISYRERFGDTSTEDRRTALKAAQNFLCECYACVNNWGPSYMPPSCLSQPSITNEIWTKLKSCNEQYDNFVMKQKFSDQNIRDESPNEIMKTIAKLVDLLNIYGEHTQYPCQEVIFVKNLLTNIYTFI